MRLYLSLFISFYFSFVCEAQRKYEAFDVLDGKTIVPPNGIRLSDSLFVDDAEVMNSNYLEYLHFLAQDSSDQVLISAYPDTNLFGTRHLVKLIKHKKDYYTKRGGKHFPLSPLEHDDIIHKPSHAHHWYNYFSYHGTQHHPVVGVSYEQAIRYCAWRSSFVTQHFNQVLKKKNKYNNFQDKEVTFVFSLPEEKAWETAASAGLDPSQFPYGYHSLAGKDSILLFNVKEQTALKEPQFIYESLPNEWGFYNMIGNVSEMVYEKGKSKGGSFMNDLPSCKILSSLPYAKPEKWLGFRCVCIVKIKHK